MTNDNRYSHGKIYKLIDNTTGIFYIGSTAMNRLDQRYANHRRFSQCDKYKNSKLYQYFTPAKFSSGEVKIILLEEVNVDNKRQLEKIENDYICKELENPLCMNTLRSFVTNEETRKGKKNYCEQNKEKIKQKRKFII